MSDEEFVRLRAYSLWIAEGQPEGREHLHWEKARREVELNGSRPERTIDEHRSPQQTATDKEQGRA